MGDGNDHEEFLHLLGDARFSTLRQRCLALEKLKKHGGLQIPWTEKSVRSLLSNLHKDECTPNYIQQAWDTLKWFSTKFQTLDVTATHRLASKKKWLQETLVSTATTPQRKAVVPAKEVILALEQGAAACGADPRRKGQVAREAIDAFILGMVRFQVGSSARFNDLQHTSPSTMKITSNTIEMMAWQTKTASAFRIKKNPVPLIAPKLSLSGVDWWTEWSKTLTLLSSLERFQDMDYLIPTLSKDFQGVIPRPSTSDRGLRWLKEALVRQGVDQGLVQNRRMPLSKAAWHMVNPRTSLRHWQQLVTAGSPVSVRGNGMSVASRLRPRPQQSTAFFFSLDGPLISGKRTFSESEAVSTEESVRELKETDESESTACAGASWTPQSLGSLNLWKHRVQ